MAESSSDRRRRLESIAALISEALVISVDRPDSGHSELSPEEREKLKAKVVESFQHFLESQEWREKTDPVIQEFKSAYLPKLLEQRLQGKVNIDESIRGTFPTLDAEFEGHAILNLVANLVLVGRFRNIKEETLAKVIEEVYMLVGVVIAYLQWRFESTTPPKGDQH